MWSRITSASNYESAVRPGSGSGDLELSRRHTETRHFRQSADTKRHTNTLETQAARVIPGYACAVKTEQRRLASLLCLLVHFWAQTRHPVLILINECPLISFSLLIFLSNRVLALKYI